MRAVVHACAARPLSAIAELTRLYTLAMPQRLSFEMSTTFPKRTFGNGDQDLALTLEEAGLSPQGVLFVSWQ